MELLAAASQYHERFQNIFSSLQMMKNYHCSASIHLSPESTIKRNINNINNM
jgi:hypothetical protein